MRCQRRDDVLLSNSVLSGEDCAFSDSPERQGSDQCGSAVAPCVIHIPACNVGPSGIIGLSPIVQERAAQRRKGLGRNFPWTYNQTQFPWVYLSRPSGSHVAQHLRLQWNGSSYSGCRLRTDDDGGAPSEAPRYRGGPHGTIMLRDRPA